MGERLPSFPAGDVTAGEQLEPATSRRAGGRPHAPILIVDDDLQIRKLFAATLQRAGYDTLEAPDGPSALALADTNHVSLVVLDVLMPRMSGFDVVAALRARSGTASTPILLVTGGTGDPEGVTRGLDAGADDFLSKPVRLSELVARVRAHLRSRETWAGLVAADLEKRAQALGAISQAAAAKSPDEAALTVVRSLAATLDCEVASVLRFRDDGRLQPLATYRRQSGTRRLGRPLSTARSRTLLARSEAGPWLEEAGGGADAGDPDARGGEIDLVANAPLHDGSTAVGLLSVGIRRSGSSGPLRQGPSVLAATIEYAATLSALIGPVIGGEARQAVTRDQLLRLIADAAFDTVFQPIVELSGRTVVGYEALTRFHDGTPPDARIAEAQASGVGMEFELATAEAALRAVDRLPPDLFVSINVSPDVALESERLDAVFSRSRRSIVLELTEHDAIEDYGALRASVAGLGKQVRLAIDDAGAGYSSLRHILELAPAYVKIDMSITRGIEANRLRQAMVVGLVHFARQAGCILIGEGIETVAEAQTLASLGVTLGQGYLFGRPAKP